ncbi:TIGR02206 family membrane protein [Edaphobacter aggregans]|uniref:YwaF family protein n=1 Tax=Edaphobacter aggregans TaxID=570835 RepID=UPI0014703B76|nr:TIGR02206 family membrane protein [Edaphobacter aggregans]
MNFTIFSPIHLAILTTVPALAAALVAIERRVSSGCKRIRIGLAMVLLLNSIVWYGYLAVRGLLIFPANLPLELCDVTLLLMILALLTHRTTIFDLAYYGALAGTSMALITPDLWEPFPSLATVQFFVTHGLVVTSALYLVWSGQARPRPRSIWRAMLGLNLFAAITGAFNFTFKTNYLYLRAKPENPSLLDSLGPWPWYIVASEGVALGLFILLYLPFWWRNSKPRQ